MARRGHRCRCCQPPGGDPCLASCRPAGESGALSAINLTLSASDYSLEFDGTTVLPFFATPPLTRNYRFRYLFPGSIYAGTFSLTPRPSNPTIYEYLFPECGDGCQGYLQYLTGQRFDNCRLQAFLPGVTEPNTWPPPDGNDDAASCGVSLPVQTLATPIVLSACGATEITLVDGSKVALVQDLSTGAFLLQGNTTLRSAIDQNFAYVSPCVFGAGNRFTIHEVVSSITELFITAENVTESGDPLVKITNIATTYA